MADLSSIAKAALRWARENPNKATGLAAGGGMIYLARERPELFVAGGTWIAGSGMFAQVPSGWLVLAFVGLAVAVARLDLLLQACERRHAEDRDELRNLKDRIADLEELVDVRTAEKAAAEDAKVAAEDALSDVFDQAVDQRKGQRRKARLPFDGADRRRAEPDPWRDA